MPKKKRQFTAKQRAAQKLFAKRARAGTLQKKRRKKSKKYKPRGGLCFRTVDEIAHYMHVKGYRVSKK